MPRVFCPFCAGTHGGQSKCPTTENIIPHSYMKQTDKPLWLLTIGLSGHGKSTFIAYQTLQLEKHLALLPGTYCQPLDSFTQKEIREMRRRAIVAKKVDQTPVDHEPRPLLFNVSHIPEFGTRNLVLFDLPGQAYDSFESIQPHARIIKQVNTLWFVVSLYDLKNEQDGRTIIELFNTYYFSMQQIGVDLEGWSLIVIYTKADKILEPLGDILSKYLNSDPLDPKPAPLYSAPVDSPTLQDYFREMDQVSQLLEEFTREKVPDGYNFIKLARAAKMKLVFTVNTALGQDPDQGGHLIGVPEPKRVIDPFIWALRLGVDQNSKPICLVVDDHLFENQKNVDRAGELWHALSDIGEVTTCLLGQGARIGSPADCPIFRTPGANRPALLGPALETNATSCPTVVFTSRPIFDLDDYNHGHYLLLLIDCSKGVIPWRRRTSWPQGESANNISRQVIEMTKEKINEQFT